MAFLIGVIGFIWAVLLLVYLSRISMYAGKILKHIEKSGQQKIVEVNDPLATAAANNPAKPSDEVTR